MLSRPLWHANREVAPSRDALVAKVPPCPADRPYATRLAADRRREHADGWRKEFVRPTRATGSTTRSSV